MNIHSVNRQPVVNNQPTSGGNPMTPFRPKTSGVQIPNTGSNSDTGFAALFSNYNPNATAPVSNPQPKTLTPTTFTAGYISGATVTDPFGNQTALNPQELADAPTASEVAQLLGGTVVNSSTSGGFTSSAATAEIQVPGSPNLINAGVAASLFAQYGTQPGSMAWQTLNRDMGISS